MPENETAAATTDTTQDTANVEKTYTQAEVNAAAASARKADKEALKAGEAAIAKLAEIEAASKSDSEKQADLIAKLKADKEAAESRVTQVELASAKERIGAELGIPASLRSRLSGTTEDELRADATSVAAELYVEPSKTPIGGGGRPTTTDTGPDVAAARKAAGLKD